MRLPPDELSFHLSQRIAHTGLQRKRGSEHPLHSAAAYASAAPLTVRGDVRRERVPAKGRGGDAAMPAASRHSPAVQA